MKTETVKLELPAEAEFVVVARLTASGIASRSLSSLADLEDLKLAVAEACNLLIGLQAKMLSLEFETAPEALQVRLSGTNCTLPVPEADSDAGLPLVLMEAVVDSLEVTTEGDTVSVTLRLERKQPLEADPGPSDTQ